MKSQGKGSPMRRLTTTLVFVAALCSMALWAPYASALPPTILSTSVTAVKTDAVTLQALIDPKGSALFYHFEYGPKDCAANPCTSVPIPDGELAPGKPELAKAEVKGLTPGTRYHFRVLAENILGESTIGPDELFATYLPPQQFGPCPNDKLRKENPSANPPEYSSANLPDCRVYEQTSPLDKDGGDATGYVPVVKASLSGDRITFSSSSGIPGGDGAQEIPMFLATRGPNGWSTQGMFPPAAEGQDAFVLGWTPDLAWVFSEARKLGEPLRGTLLARPSAGGQVETIVDHTDDFFANAFAGTSADAAEVLFESKKALLEGAVEGKPNLYLFQRDSKELFLAGALNDEEAPPEGAFAGSYDWVSGTTKETLSRGGAERGYYTRDQHAISEDGSKVYFTAAATGQLYLRLNPTEEQSPLDEGKCTDEDLACTVNVSASRKTNGKGVEGKDAAGTRPAAFLGASADGSFAYFSSSEKLTNDANTGLEPTNPPAIARATLDGNPNFNVKFVAANSEELAIGEGNILCWTTPSGSIARCVIVVPVDQCTAIEEDFIPAQFTENPKGLTISDTHIYWTNEGTSKAEEEAGVTPVIEASIGRAEIDGENPEQGFIKETFTKEPGDPPLLLVSEPRGIDVDATHVYWVNAGIPTRGTNWAMWRGLRSTATRKAWCRNSRASLTATWRSTPPISTTPSSRKLLLRVRSGGLKSKAAAQKKESLDSQIPVPPLSPSMPPTSTGPTTTPARSDGPTSMAKMRKRNGSKTPAAPRAWGSTRPTSTGPPTRKCSPTPATTSTAMRRTPTPSQT